MPPKNHAVDAEAQAKADATSLAEKASDEAYQKAMGLPTSLESAQAEVAEAEAQAVADADAAAAKGQATAYADATAAAEAEAQAKADAEAAAAAEAEAQAKIDADAAAAAEAEAQAKIDADAAAAAEAEAQAKIDADAAAEVLAKADEEAVAAKATAARKAAPDADKLKALLEDIGANMHHHLLTGMIDRLKTEERLRIGDRDGDGITTVKLAGIEATSTSGQFGAMTNWCNAARRWLLEKGAA